MNPRAPWRMMGATVLAVALGSGSSRAQAVLCDGHHPGNPVLLSGVASCLYNEVNGAGHTVIDLGTSSIIRWDHLGLDRAGATLTFQWSGEAGEAALVINEVEGGNAGRGNSQHLVAGQAGFPDGDLVIVNPGSTPRLSGTIAARSVLFATHRLDPEQADSLRSGGPAEFTGGRWPLEVVGGRIVATHGDVVLAGRSVQNSAVSLPGEEAPGIVAEEGSVRIFGGQAFRLRPAGRERLEPLPGDTDGSIRNSKGIRAGREVELSAVAAIDNLGAIEAAGGSGRIFLRVDDPAGQINNDATGFIRGFVQASHPVRNSGRIVPDESDAPSSLSTGIARHRIPPRPGDKNAESTVVVRYENAPTAGSANAQRDRRGEGGRRSSSGQVARHEGRPVLASGRSFFGLRGGSPKRERESDR